MALQNQLDVLEQQLSQLLSVLQALHAENDYLRQQQQQLMDECVHLQQKNEAASAQIEAILTRLRQQTRLSTEEAKHG
ncbi:MAG: hypothetical protein CR991_00145 [Proteobacteria bacterium]|nr:MAG: hypothetical protein CR991_00145 [Pseudomonadota bacterium]